MRGKRGADEARTDAEDGESHTYVRGGRQFGDERRRGPVARGGVPRHQVLRGLEKKTQNNPKLISREEERDARACSFG